jgi:hypothetical protein
VRVQVADMTKSEQPDFLKKDHVGKLALVPPPV